MNPKTPACHSLIRLQRGAALATFMTAAFLAPSAQGQTLLYQWGFNETGTTAPSTVPSSPNVNLSLLNASSTLADKHGAPGSGVSGEAGDRAFNNVGSTVGGSGGQAQALNFTNSTGVLNSFTTTMWINPSSLSPTNQFPRLFIIGPGGTTDSGVGEHHRRGFDDNFRFLGEPNAWRWYR